MDKYPWLLCAAVSCYRPAKPVNGVPEKAVIIFKAASPTKRGSLLLASSDN